MLSVSLNWLIGCLLFLSWTRRVIADVDAPCYAPNKSLAEGMYPCDPTAFITACCPWGWTCYSNDMCVVTDPGTVDDSHPVGTSLRSACTNPEWNSAICGDYCLDDANADGRLVACGDNQFCCENDESCSCSDGAFRFDNGKAQTIIGVEGMEHTETSTFPTRTSTSISGVSTTSDASTTFVSTTSSTSAEPTKTEAPPAKKAVDKPGVKAGIAIGAVLGFLLLCAVAWLISKRYRKEYVYRRNPAPLQPTSELPRAPSINDPYRPENATNLTLGIPMPDPKQSSSFYAGNAPFENEYERNAPSRGPMANSTTTIGSATLRGVYGARPVGGRSVSIESIEEETTYPNGYSRPSEMDARGV